MDIYVPNKRLWIPDNTIADSLASPPAISRMIAYNTKKRICSLTPHRVMMGAAGGGILPPDATSYAIDGVDDALSLADHANWDIFADTDDATIDFWIKFTDHAGTEFIVVQNEAQTSDNYWYIRHVHGSGLHFQFDSSSAAIITLSGGEVTDTNWHHAALCKVGTEYGLYLDDIQTAYVNDASTDTLTGPLFWGKRDIPVSQLPFDGNLDDMRIYDGNPFGAAPNVSLTDTITRPTAQHISDANTLMLINCGETIVSGTTGSGATFLERGVSNLTVTEENQAIRDLVDYKW
jgi:hypothetical protein